MSNFAIIHTNGPWTAIYFIMDMKELELLVSIGPPGPVEVSQAGRACVLKVTWKTFRETDLFFLPEVFIFSAHKCVFTKFYKKGQRAEIRPQNQDRS